jgi:hypothetical protein
LLFSCRFDGGDKKQTLRRELAVTPNVISGADRRCSISVAERSVDNGQTEGEKDASDEGRGRERS